jgi:hypothetical protein
MASLNDEEIWSVLQEQAAEDEWLEEQIREVAAMSDAALDEELRKGGCDVASIDKQAAEFAASAMRPASAPAVEQKAPRRSHRPPPRRPVVLYVAAAAVVAVGGGLIYSALTRPPEHAPPTPEPTPSTPPQLEPLPPDLIAATDLRMRAAAALEAGHPDECLSLLDEARARDPAGDKAPEIQKLRERAIAKKPR